MLESLEERVVLNSSLAPPVAQDAGVQTAAGAPVVINVLANDTDPNGLSLLPSSLVIRSAPTEGQVSVNPSTGAITYTPSPNFSGTDGFGYAVSDSAGLTSNVAAVNVVVTRPTAADDWTDTDGTTPVTLNILANDTDPNGNQHLLANSVSIVASPTNGQVKVNADGTVAYAANANFTGTDSFQYTVKDDVGAVSNVATAFVRVNVPTATDDLASFTGTTPTTIDVLANDTDPDGNGHILTNSVALVGAPPANGHVVVNANGTITYTANPGFNGTDTFQYTIRDDNGATSRPATVTVVGFQQGAINGDFTDTDGTTPVTLNVLANDSASGGATLVASSVRIVGAPARGQAIVNADGSITYTATAGFTGTDRFLYTVTDSKGVVSSPTAVSVRVNAPTAADDWTDTDGTTPVTLDVLANDTDPDGNQHLLANSVTIVSPPSNGQMKVNADGTVTYVANANFTGTDRFQYTVRDDNGATSNVATAFVRVNTPAAADDLAFFQGTTPVQIDVLANDADPDGNQHLVPGSVTIVNSPINGHAVVNADGTITYTANANFTGTDHFQYTVQDDNGATSLPATVTVVFGKPSVIVTPPPPISTPPNGGSPPNGGGQAVNSVSPLLQLESTAFTLAQDVLAALGEANIGRLDANLITQIDLLLLDMFTNPLSYTLSGELAIFSGFEEAL
ncbi:MAG TPA: Ig-like domain-containing protein [Gemmataceae bacterium]|jgi:hypothetical protein